MLIYERIVHRKNRLLCQLVTEKITILYFYISAVCSLTDTPTDKIFVEQMVIYERKEHRKYQTFFFIQVPHFPQNVSSIRLRTYRQTDIWKYRAASLLKNLNNKKLVLILLLYKCKLSFLPKLNILNKQQLSNFRMSSLYGTIPCFDLGS